MTYQKERLTFAFARFLCQRLVRVSKFPCAMRRFDQLYRKRRAGRRDRWWEQGGCRNGGGGRGVKIVEEQEAGPYNAV